MSQCHLLCWGLAGRRFSTLFESLVIESTHETTVYDPHPEGGEHSGGSGGVYMTARVDAGPDDASEIIHAVKEWLNGGR